MNWQTALLIGSGGFLGAISRAYIGQLVSLKFPHAVPWGTLTVNLVGSLVMGVLMAIFTHSSFLSPHLKSLVTTGFLGALTTYSTFAIESFLLLESGQFMWAMTNISLNLLGTILMAGGGYWGVSVLLK